MVFGVGVGVYRFVNIGGCYTLAVLPWLAVLDGCAGWVRDRNSPCFDALGLSCRESERSHGPPPF